MEKYRVGILGATGMVGQRLLCLLENHPFFDVTALAAGPRSAGRTFSQATAGRWKMKTAAPARCTNMPVFDAVSEMEKIRERVDFVFCAVDMPKEDVLALEEMYARAEVPVVSNNSANRWTPDVPMLIPEINAAHIALIAAQRRRLGTRRGFVVVKPNCSIQSYVPALTPLRRFGLEQVSVTTFQAVSGAGHTLADMPEIIDNVIPYIPGEEEKSEREPLRVWGTPKDGAVELAAAPVISAQCLRVPVSDGHMAAVSVRFAQKPALEQILAAWRDENAFARFPDCPTAPGRFLYVFEEPDRPQTRLDRDLEGGMAVSVGRLREDPVLDYKFIALSHNTLRGAAGGALLTAEILATKGYFDR